MKYQHSEWTCTRVLERAVYFSSGSDKGSFYDTRMGNEHPTKAIFSHLYIIFFYLYDVFLFV